MASDSEAAAHPADADVAHGLAARAACGGGGEGEGTEAEGDGVV